MSIRKELLGWLFQEAGEPGTWYWDPRHFPKWHRRLPKVRDLPSIGQEVGRLQEPRRMIGE